LNRGHEPIIKSGFLTHNIYASAKAELNLFILNKSNCFSYSWANILHEHTAT